MRKIDIENSSDYYKECLNSALHCMAEMSKAFEKSQESFRERINELEVKLKKVGEKGENET